VDWKEIRRMVGIGQSVQARKEDGLEVIGRTVSIGPKNLMVRDGDGKLRLIPCQDIESIVSATSYSRSASLVEA